MPLHVCHTQGALDSYPFPDSFAPQSRGAALLKSRERLDGRRGRSVPTMHQKEQYAQTNPASGERRPENQPLSGAPGP